MSMQSFNSLPVGTTGSSGCIQSSHEDERSERKPRRLAIRRFIPALIFAVSAFVPINASAQSFLERLEKAVKNQLAEPQSPPESESSQELPPPKIGPGANANATGRTPPPQPTPPSNLGTAASLKPSQSKGGRIFLGLEGEDPIGAGIGVRVSGLTKNSPAWKAGFVVGDRILAINGFAIARLNDMVEQLGKTRPGDTVRFLVSRAGRNIKLTAVLMAAELAEQTVIGASPETQNGTPFVGVTVNDLTSSFRKQFGISVFTGAAVSGVAKGSPAEKAGIRAGDAIIELNGAPIESADDLRGQVSQLVPGQKVEVLYYRGGFGKQVEFVVGNLLGTLSSGRTSSSVSPPRVPLAQQGPQTPPASTVIPAGPSNGPVPDPSVSTLPSILEQPLARSESGQQDLEVGKGTLALEPSTAPGSLNAASPNSGNTTGATQAAEMTQRMVELEAENALLADQLKATQIELAKTREKLDQILELLKQR